MTAAQPEFQLKLADCAADLRAAQRLRYDVFVSELGGDGAQTDHAQGLERDDYDPFFDHLLLQDQNRSASDQVVGVYRLLRSDQVERVGQYYSEDEYDLSVLHRSGRRLLELGRTCVHPDYRGGTAMYELWSGLADYVARHRIEVLFGVASFHGIDIAALAQPLSLLHYRHLAPPDLRVVARSGQARRMDILARQAVDRRAATLATPALIKAYLRLGGFVGQGAWIDTKFNTTDVCLIMDMARMSARQSAIYTKKRTAG